MCPHCPEPTPSFQSHSYQLNGISVHLSPRWPVSQLVFLPQLPRGPVLGPHTCKVIFYSVNLMMLSPFFKDFRDSLLSCRKKIQASQNGIQALPGLLFWSYLFCTLVSHPTLQPYQRLCSSLSSLSYFIPHYFCSGC